MITETTRISFSERELNILYAWIYADFKPVETVDIDIKILKKLKDACVRLGCEDIIDDWKDSSEVDADEELERQNEIRSLTDIDGMFFCRDCNYRTNQKTPTTCCLVCGKPLSRG